MEKNFRQNTRTFLSFKDKKLKVLIFGTPKVKNTIHTTIKLAYQSAGALLESLGNGLAFPEVAR